jgi:hypothetical protein
VDQRLLQPAKVQPAILLGNYLKAEGPLVVIGHDLHVAHLEHHGAHGEVGRKKVLAGGLCSH